MDKAGIKLKLAEWSKFNIEERIELAKKTCNTGEEAKEYNHYLADLIKDHTGNEATSLEIDQSPAWSDINLVPVAVNEKANEFGISVSSAQWQRLTNLQRFALIKLSRPGHESKNFIKAVREFKLVNDKHSSLEVGIL
jgi:hypothetical protein